MLTNESTELTPREWQQMEYDKDSTRSAYEHDLKKSELQIQLQLAINNGEIELKKLESKWTSWFSLPKYLIKLPVLFLFGIAYICHSIRGTKPTKEFWEFISK